MYVYTLKFVDPVSKKTRWYVGSRWSKRSSPSDLFVTYFTSSRSIKELIQEHGTNSFTVKIVKIFDDETQTKNYEEALVRRAIRRGFRLRHELINGNIPNSGWQTMSTAGMPKDPVAMKKMVQTRRLNGTYDGGSKHPRARKFKLVLADGTIHEIHGNLKKKCKELGLSWQTLYNNLDSGVIKLDRKRYKNLARLTQAFHNTIGCELRSATSVESHRPR